MIGSVLWSKNAVAVSPLLCTSNGVLGVRYTDDVYPIASIIKTIDSEPHLWEDCPHRRCVICLFPSTYYLSLDTIVLPGVARATSNWTPSYKHHLHR
jgi:hypothetical protein